MIEKGRPWGRAARTGPDLEVSGDDADLAAAAAAAPGRLVQFRPSVTSDLGRAMGLGLESPDATEVAVDLLRVDTAAGSRLAVNAAVLGPPPHRLRAWHRAVDMVVEVDGRERFAGRATTVVVANGQFLHGLDVVPRGHPGDGRVEVHVYALRPGRRAAMRRRLPQGTHLPHPRIVQATGRHIVVRSRRELSLELDGHPLETAREVTLEVSPAALRLLI